MKKSLAALVGLVVLSACARAPALEPRAGLTALRQEALPAPMRQDLTSPGRPYVIGPFDQLSIEVFALPEFSRSVQADAGGRVAYPLVGTIDASGLTPEELSQRIAAGLTQYVRDPKVTVNVTDTVSNLVTLDGQVNEPGMYPVLGKMTLMRAIASAKGLTEFAQVEEVVLFREVGGQEYAALYDLGAIRRGAYEDPEVYANDIVIVGDSPSRRLLRNALQAAPTLVAPLVALIQRN